ncbi:MAG TPA: hypothetical protein VK835_04960 [Bacteroidia bacterium]|jgi:hypothetical protein|nr:hypothetical protein [Bacteroidia bacterium]
MRNIYKIIVLIFCFTVSEIAFSQSAQQALDQGQDVNVLFRNESTGGVYMHSRGFGAIYRRYWHVTGKLKRLIEIEGLNMKHPKEISEKSNEGGKSYKYGKLNGLLFLRAGFGFQRKLYERAERKSIEVRMIYTAGVTVGISKPVYLQIMYPDPTNQNTYVLKNEAYDPAIHNQSNILGRSPYFDGLQALKLHPGAYAKLGFSFEYGSRTNMIKAVETGVAVDCFPKAIQTMAQNKAENFFVTLYVAIHIGKRWF